MERNGPISIRSPASSWPDGKVGQALKTRAAPAGRLYSERMGLHLTASGVFFNQGLIFGAVFPKVRIQEFGSQGVVEELTLTVVPRDQVGSLRCLLVFLFQS